MVRALTVAVVVVVDTYTQLFTRNLFTLRKEIFLQSSIIPDNEISIHQAVSQLFLIGG